MTRPGASAALLLGALAWPWAAEAHLVNTRLGDFYGGMLHPVTGFEHVVPWLALACLAALQGPQRGRWIVVAFPVALLIGTALAYAVPDIAGIGTVNTVSFVVLGGLVALALPVPVPALVALAALAGLSHGYENGLAATAGTDRVLFVLGVTAVGYGIVTLVSGAATRFLAAGMGGWRRVTLRAGGSWIAAVGVMLLAFRLFAPAKLVAGLH